MSTSSPSEVLAEEEKTPSSSTWGLQQSLAALAVLLALSGFFHYVAGHRFIDQDEGSYLLASRLVLSHKTPYLDFFWNQAPLFPYVYAGWLRIAGATWSSGRTLSVLLSVLLGVLLFSYSYRQTRKCFSALFAVVLYASSTLVFAWYPIAKTHSLAALLLFAAYVVLSDGSDKFSWWQPFVAGVLLGLSVDTRSYLLLLFPVFACWVVKVPNTQYRRSRLWSLVGGFVVGTLPSICLFLRSPNVFIFDNLLYHSIRSGEGLIGWWAEKLVLVVQLFLGSPEGNGLQWSILFLISAALISSTPRRDPCRLAFRVGTFLALICLLPTPTYLQYFSLCVPFFIISTVCVVHDLCANLGTKTARLGLMAGVVLLLLVYVSISAKDLNSYLFTGDGVPGMRLVHNRDDWKIDQVVAVSNAVAEHIRPGDIVASFWPGDIFQTSASPLAGIENPFALPISEKLTADQRVRYHILSPDEILLAFAALKPKVVVLRSQMMAAVTAEEFQRMQGLVQEFRSALTADGYSLVRSVGGISIYVYANR